MAVRGRDKGGCGPPGRTRDGGRRAPPLPVLAFAVLLALATAGCAGVRSASTATSAAAGHRPAAAEVRLVVTRDFGAKVLLDTVAPWKKGMTVMRLLAEHTTVDTGYGGQFVSGIDGVRSSFGSVSSADAADWFYWVDGMMADVGADGWRLHGGETVWWDYHRWAGSMFIPVSLDAFPAPFAGRVALGGRSSLTAQVRRWAEALGLTLRPSEAVGSAQQGAGVTFTDESELPSTDLVVAADLDTALLMPWLTEAIDRGPASGVFVRLRPGQIIPLTGAGAAGSPADGAALAVPNPVSPQHQVLVLLATNASSLDSLLAALTPATLAHHVAVYLPAGASSVVPLPLMEPK